MMLLIRNSELKQGEKKLCSTVPTWRYKQPEYTKVYDHSEAYENNLLKMKEQLKGSTPVKVFEEIFSEEIVQFIIKESVRYATETNRPATTSSSDEIKIFIGVLLISGYHKLPAETHYWSNDEDLGLQTVKNALSKSKFQELKSILHFCDNN